MAGTLVIGGSSGLGLELAKRRLAEGLVVHVTGRHNPRVGGLSFHQLELDDRDLPTKLRRLYKEVGVVECLIVSAGFYQAGKLDELSEAEIETMLSVGARALIYGVRELLLAQKQIPELIVITSTSQFVARVNEPVYNFVKAGAGHFTRAMADDERIGKVLLVAPGGMKTAFWRNATNGTALLDPAWVADEISVAENGAYRYRFIKIFREPKHTEEIETL